MKSAVGYTFQYSCACRIPGYTAQMPKINPFGIHRTIKVYGYIGMYVRRIPHCAPQACCELSLKVVIPEINVGQTLKFQQDQLNI